MRSYVPQLALYAFGASSALISFAGCGKIGAEAMFIVHVFGDHSKLVQVKNIEAWTNRQIDEILRDAEAELTLEALESLVDAPAHIAVHIHSNGRIDFRSIGVDAPAPAAREVEEIIAKLGARAQVEFK